MDLTKTIRTLRESKGLTQEVLAERFGVTRSNYAYLEGRGNKLTIEQLEKIAGALGVSVMELLTGEIKKAEDSEEAELLKERVKELKKIITLYENSEETAKNHIKLLTNSVLKLLYFFVNIRDLTSTIIYPNDEEYEEYEDDPLIERLESKIENLETEFKIFRTTLKQLSCFTDNEIELQILKLGISEFMIYEDFIFKIINIIVYNRGIFSEKLHEHFSKQYEAYQQFLRKPPSHDYNDIQQSLFPNEKCS